MNVDLTPHHNAALFIGFSLEQLATMVCCQDQTLILHLRADEHSASIQVLGESQSLSADAICILLGKTLGQLSCSIDEALKTCIDWLLTTPRVLVLVEADNNPDLVRQLILSHDNRQLVLWFIGGQKAMPDGHIQAQHHWVNPQSDGGQRYLERRMHRSRERPQTIRYQELLNENRILHFNRPKNQIDAHEAEALHLCS